MDGISARRGGTAAKYSRTAMLIGRRFRRQRGGRRLWVRLARCDVDTVFATERNANGVFGQACCEIKFPGFQEAREVRKKSQSGS